MTTLTIALYFVVGVLVVIFLAAAFASLVFTKRRNGRLERLAGDVAFIAFLSALGVTLGAVTQSVRVLVAAIALAALLAIAGFVSRPRCPRCGQGLNLLTNRQFREVRCVFCGASES